MSFLAPLALFGLLAVPVAVVAQVRAQRARARRRAELAAQALVLSGPAARNRRRDVVPFGLFTLALAVLVVGAARPQLDLGIPVRQGTVILAFDTSNSMLAADLEPTRLDAAKAAAQRFVDAQPAEIRIGIVGFGDGAVVLQQPTLERVDVTAAIARIKVGGGTSLGQGLYTGLGAIAGEPLALDPETLERELQREDPDIDVGYYGASAIVVLSDGENTGPPDPVQVARLASVAGVAVHTVGIGDTNGTVVEVDGFNIATALDAALLEAIAETTGGTYSEATDAEGLASVYESLDLEFVRTGEPTEVTALFAAVGGVLAIVGAALSLRWFGRVI